MEDFGDKIIWLFERSRDEIESCIDNEVCDGPQTSEIHMQPSFVDENQTIFMLTLSLMAGAIQWPPLAKSAHVLQGMSFEWPHLVDNSYLGIGIGLFWKIKICIKRGLLKDFPILYTQKHSGIKLATAFLRPFSAFRTHSGYRDSGYHHQPSAIIIILSSDL